MGLGSKLNKEADSNEELGKIATFSIKPLMEKIRTIVDEFEQELPKKLWPYPSYSELLHSYS
jgi:glutamine synthetase type III